MCTLADDACFTESTSKASQLDIDVSAVEDIANDVEEQDKTEGITQRSHLRIRDNGVDAIIDGTADS